MPDVKIKNLKGEQGGQFIDDVTPQPVAPAEACWCAFQVIEDATVAAITMPSFVNSDALVGVVLPAGTIIYGHMTAITLSAGTVQMFNSIRSEGWDAINNH
jgi:hypothetical protein